MSDPKELSVEEVSMHYNGNWVVHISYNGIKKEIVLPIDVSSTIAVVAIWDNFKFEMGDNTILYLKIIVKYSKYISNIKKHNIYHRFLINLDTEEVY